MLFEGVVAVVAERSRSPKPPPSLGIYFELHSAEMYAVLLKPNFWLLSFLAVTDNLIEKREVHLLHNSSAKSLTYACFAKISNS
jgi:hypothetical protein